MHVKWYRNRTVVTSYLFPYIFAHFPTLSHEGHRISSRMPQANYVGNVLAWYGYICPRAGEQRKRIVGGKRKKIERNQIIAALRADELDLCKSIWGWVRLMTVVYCYCFFCYHITIRFCKRVGWRPGWVDCCNEWYWKGKLRCQSIPWRLIFAWSAKSRNSMKWTKQIV